MIGLVIIIVVVVCDPTNWFVNNRDKFLGGIFTNNVVALTSLYLSKAGLEVLAGTDFNLLVATVKAGKVFSPLLDVMDKGINFLTFTSAILACMKVALGLFTSYLFKGLLVGALVASLWSKVRKSALSVAIFLIMLNPGLPLYLLLAQGAAYAMETTDDPSNADKLKEVATANAMETKDDPSDAHKLKEAATAAKKKFDGYSETVTNKAKSYLNSKLPDWGNWSKLAGDVSDEANEMTKIIVNMLAKAIILYVLMPLGYYYFLRLALRPLIESVNSD